MKKALALLLLPICLSGCGGIGAINTIIGLAPTLRFRNEASYNVDVYFVGQPVSGVADLSGERAFATNIKNGVTTSKKTDKPDSWQVVVTQTGTKNVLAYANRSLGLDEDVTAVYREIGGPIVEFER